MSKYDKFEGHTPGPWKCKGDGKIYADKNTVVAIAVDPLMHPCDETALQDYTLLRSAPALLAACKRKDELFRDVLYNLEKGRDFMYENGNEADGYDLAVHCEAIAHELNREEI